MRNPLASTAALTTQNFWRIADHERMAEEYRVDRDLQYLRTAPLDELKKIFVQYRFFTIYYITDLALLVARLPFGQLRSSLAHFLDEELGHGDPADAHPRLYDDFLLSLGIDESDLHAPNRRCVKSLEGVRQSLHAKSWAYGVGLRGMGGECLCQIYLSSMYENFIQNPVIQEMKDQIKWKFWDIHIGDVDIAHREQTRAAIDELLHAQPDKIDELAGGYLESKGAWDEFWKEIFYEAKGSRKSRAHARARMDLSHLGAASLGLGAVR